jgi:hypothetical protein
LLADSLVVAVVEVSIFANLINLLGVVLVVEDEFSIVVGQNLYFSFETVKLVLTSFKDAPWVCFLMWKLRIMVSSSVLTVILRLMTDKPGVS